MKIYTDKKDCCGCGSCAEVCPTGAARMAPDEEGFLYPQVDEKECIKCGCCETVCPMKKTVTESDNHRYFGVQARDEKIRYESSSGGMFPILAEYVLKRQGVVYGASYDEDMKVEHREAHNIEELKNIKKTKYVQSNLKGIFNKIAVQLKEGRWVLFCGTPCQAEALRLFLKNPYPQLIIIDLICYGVPSPGIWEAYVRYLEKKHKGKMTNFFFRDKRNRDNGHTCSYVISGREYAGSMYEDSYCRMYFTNYTVRPACHHCHFCTVSRNSDFTIGDFWGIEKVMPEIDDGMGTSLVILHTKKAEGIWEEAKADVTWFECRKKDILQPRLLEPATVAKRRKMFMMVYKKMPFSFFLAFYKIIICGSVRLQNSFVFRRKQ